MPKFFLFWLALPALAASCRGASADRSSRGSSSLADSVSAIPASPERSASKTTCARTGSWARCSVEKRLERSGFVVRPDTTRPIRRPGFSVLPTVYTLGRSRLEVFLYSSSDAAAHDVAGLDTVVAAPRGSRGGWPAQPTFVRNTNLIAVFLTDSPVQAERLSLALGAGPPQP